MNKRDIKILSFSIIFLLGIPLFIIYKYKSKLINQQKESKQVKNLFSTDKSDKNYNTDKNLENKEDEQSLKNAFVYDLISNKILIIQKEEQNYFFEGEQSSTIENVIIFFEKTYSNIIHVVSKEMAKRMIQRIKFSQNYENDIQKLMAIHTFDKCMSLKAENISQKDIKQKHIYIGSLFNNCDKTLTKVYGFELDDFYITIVLHAKNDVELNNFDKKAVKIIENISIKSK